MPYSNITKHALAEALRKLLEQMPFSKISVSHICKECGMNRKSFYYHFQDKYDLVNWIFDTEIEEVLSGLPSQEQCFSWKVVEVLCEYFYEHRAFYSKVFQIEGQNSLMEHFRESLIPVNRWFLKNMQMDDRENEDFYIHFYSDAMMAALVRWLEEKECMPPEKFIALLRSSVELLADYVTGHYGDK